ncbi:magnesium-chelatase subunit chlI [Mycobacterium tuberculosis]|nr:magnesium-chelatase subunit chlI [Mycobacterium tuberculosis]
MSPSNLPRTVGELRAAGHRERGVKQEIRENLLTALADGDNVWPGILGFDDTVIPQVERALIAGHDFVLLGERGQGKTRLLRALAGLLDEWTPVIAGAELGEHPYTPITPESIRRAAQLGDALPVAWKHRSERYTEKLATPDTSVADLVGDVDPIKVAEGRSLGDPETIAYGLIPRAHRGIVAVNELPDLAERIQVSMLNVMEERDIQVRGYTLRLPLDVLVVASANPEDYTNRGRIITPIKDRFGAEIRTHYPLELEAEMGVIVQEAHLSAQVPDYLMQVLARFARYLRESRSIDQRSGVSARFAIAAAETVAAAARHRGAVLGETDPVARVVDLGTVIDVLRGKLEFESGEEGREQAVLEHLLRRATADTASRVLGGIDVGSLVTAVEGGSAVTTGERVSAKDVLAAVPGLPVVDRIARKLGAESEGERAAALELALEALYLAKRVDKVCGEVATLLGVHRRARPAGPAGGSAGCAGTDWPRRHGGRLAAPGAVRAAAAGHQEPDRRRPAGGRGEPPPTGVVAPQQLRWHLAGDQEAARRGRAGRTQGAGPRARRRRPLRRAAAGRASGLAGQGSTGAGRIPLAQRAGPRKV